MNAADDLTMWSLLVGFFLPLIISVVQQPRWTNRVRAIVAAVSCALAGLGTAYFQGDLLDGRSVVSAILVVLVTAVAIYHNFWKPVGAAPKIEAATSPKPTRHAYLDRDRGESDVMALILVVIFVLALLAAFTAVL